MGFGVAEFGQAHTVLLVKTLATRRADARRKLQGMVVTMRSLRVLREAGLSGGPRDGVRSYVFAKKYGPFAGLVESAAQRSGAAVAITDYAGDVTFDELNRRVNALSRAWSRDGIGPGTVVAALCRDHRGLITVLAATNKVGGQLLLLNTGFAKPQLADVARRECVSVLALRWMPKRSRSTFVPTWPGTRCRGRSSFWLPCRATRPAKWCAAPSAGMRRDERG